MTFLTIEQQDNIMGAVSLIGMLNKLTPNQRREVLIICQVDPEAPNAQELAANKVNERLAQIGLGLSFLNEK